MESYFSSHNLIRQTVNVGINVAGSVGIYYLHRAQNDYECWKVAIVGAVTGGVGGWIAFTNYMPLSAITIGSISLGMIAENFPHPTAHAPVPLAIGSALAVILNPYIYAMDQVTRNPIKGNLFIAYVTSLVSTVVLQESEKAIVNVMDFKKENDDAIAATILPVFIITIGVIMGHSISKYMTPFDADIYLVLPRLDGERVFEGLGGYVGADFQQLEGH